MVSLLDGPINRWHSCVAQVPSVPVVLIVHFIILTVRSVISTFSREASLDAFVHRGTFEALLWGLSLGVSHVLLMTVARVRHVAA